MNKSFLTGVTSVLDLFPTEREEVIIELPAHSDVEAIKKDLEQVGNDMFFAVKLVQREENNNKN